MKALVAATVIALLPAAARANVVYTFTDPPPFIFPDGVDTITVSDAAYLSGSLTFDSVCGAEFVCTVEPPPPGWISGFEFPNFISSAHVDLTFGGPLLTGQIHVDLGSSDLAWTYQGSGTDWTATFIDGVETTTSQGFYTLVGDPPVAPVPEPATIGAFLAGLGGLAFAQGKRRRDRSQRPF
jgi:hypothetical protein